MPLLPANSQYLMNVPGIEFRLLGKPANMRLAVERARSASQRNALNGPSETPGMLEVFP